MDIQHLTKINITASNIFHFRNIGYSPTIRNTLEVKVCDLPPISSTRINIKCDECGMIVEKCVRDINKSRGKFDGKDYCRRCVAKITSVKKPQCNSTYWSDPERKVKHGNSIRNSTSYQSSRKSFNVLGENNGMYGKHHTLETRRRMSVNRTGKKQSKATIEKRVNTFKEKYKNREIKGMSKCIKAHLHTNIKWYRRVYERDAFKCVKCGGNKPKLDAHHIMPLSHIIKRLSLGKKFLSDKDRYDWLIQQPEILDMELTNGITLCRICHMKEHKNWGSHNIL